MNDTMPNYETPIIVYKFLHTLGNFVAHSVNFIQRKTYYSLLIDHKTDPIDSYSFLNDEYICLKWLQSFGADILKNSDLYMNIAGIYKKSYNMKVSFDRNIIKFVDVINKRTNDDQVFQYLVYIIAERSIQLLIEYSNKINPTMDLHDPRNIVNKLLTFYEDLIHTFEVEWVLYKQYKHMTIGSDLY